MTFRRRLEREYRRFATGLCFLVFMTGGVVGSLIYLPLLRLFPMSREARRKRGLAYVQGSFRAFTGFMCGVRVIRRFEVRGLDALAGGGPYLYVGNHPTLIDVVNAMGRVPDCNCIVKKSLWHHPFMGGVLRLSGLLSNDDGPELMKRIEEELHAGRSLMVFPEGTRSPEGKLGRFTRGAARLALHLDIPIVPIRITCAPSTLRKGQKWYEVPDRAVVFRLDFGDPIDPRAVVADAPSRPIEARRLTRYLEDHFCRALDLEMVDQGRQGGPAR